MRFITGITGSKNITFYIFFIITDGFNNNQQSFEQKDCKKLTDSTKIIPYPILSTKIVKGKFGRVVLLE